MKKLLTLIVGTIMVWSCKKNDANDNFIESISHQVTVTYGELYNNKPAEGVSLKFLNRGTSASYNATTGANGIATITIPAGEYEIMASKILSASEAENLTGQNTEVAFNGNIPNITINSNQNTPSVINLTSGRIGNLIIKQVYYAGSDTRKAANFRDQFFEIHNNSNEVIYLDGYCFAQIRGATNSSEANNGKKGYLIGGGYDWSKAEGLTDQGEKANTDFVYAEEVIAFPGSGNQYPLAPGKSVIVAQNALNHKQPLTVIENGKTKTYEVTSPELTIDLSRAQFEAYYANYLNTKGLATDIDNPEVPNMEILYKISGNRDMILDTFGRDAFIIFKEDKTTIDTWRKAPLPTINEQNTETAVRFLQIPNSVVIDGVHLQHFNDKNAIPRRLPTIIDAGQIKGIKGNYSSESAIRKVKKNIGTRVIYQDTNNSTNDFEIIALPDTSSLN